MRKRWTKRHILFRDDGLTPCLRRWLARHGTRERRAVARIDEGSASIRGFLLYTQLSAPLIVLEGLGIANTAQRTG